MRGAMVPSLKYVPMSNARKKRESLPICHLFLIFFQKAKERRSIFIYHIFHESSIELTYATD